MKSKFEKYLIDNRNRLDVEEPDDRLIWNGISNNLNKRRNTVNVNVWKAAALILVLITTSYFVFDRYFSQKQKIYSVTLGDIDPSLSETENEYIMIINSKMNQIGHIDPSLNDILKDCFGELENLDKMYREYQRDFYQLGYNERLIRAISDYYEKKVRILNRMLMEIQKQKDYEKKQNEIEL
jgi:hypothetical protein